MKIALLGAPGSGKSSLARKISAALTASGQSVKIVDRYVDGLTKRTGAAYGIHATFPQNFQILSERWTKEQEAELAQPDIIVVCGSIHESILHNAIRFNNEAVHRAGQMTMIQGKILMQALGVIESLIGDHDILFFLPYDEKTLAEKGRSYDMVVNEKLPEVVAGSFKPLFELAGDPKKKVADVLRAIEAYATYAAEVSAADEQQAV